MKPRQIVVLELGSYVAPAYAGMLLAEQGALVEKWVAAPGDRDPILGLEHGRELWDWINEGKTIVEWDVRQLGRMTAVPLLSAYDVVIDNFRPSTLERWGIDPAKLAEQSKLVWVSLRSEVGEYSFDVVAQARAWMEHVPWLPFYVGDTVPGAMLAFKAMSMVAFGKPGHYILGQATCLEKLIEGELQVEGSWRIGATRWDPKGTYWADGDGAHVDFRGVQIDEPIRTKEWKLAHLYHNGNGRMRL